MNYEQLKVLLETLQKAKSHEEVFKMDILHACIKEALRLFPPLIFLMRRVVNKPLDVCGYTVPVGYNVWVSNAVAQRLPEVFENPDVYDPSRWLNFDIQLPLYIHLLDLVLESIHAWGSPLHSCSCGPYLQLFYRCLI